jgi:hypothetical protein
MNAAKDDRSPPLATLGAEGKTSICRSERGWRKFAVAVA